MIAKKAMALLAALALAGAVLLGLWVQSLRAENERLGGAVDGLTAELQLERDLRLVDQQVAADYKKRLDKLTTQRIANEAKLSRALAASPEWASGRVPDSIADALGLRDPDEGGNTP